MKPLQLILVRYDLGPILILKYFRRILELGLNFEAHGQLLTVFGNGLKTSI